MPLLEMSKDIHPPACMAREHPTDLPASLSLQSFWVPCPRHDRAGFTACSALLASQKPSQQRGHLGLPVVPLVTPLVEAPRPYPMNTGLWEVL